MKKTGLLNSELSKVISELGHTDQIVICDAGLPIPPNVKRIDLALTPGLPPFLDTLRAVLLEMQVEKVIVAKEIQTASPDLLKQIDSLLAGVEQASVSHEEFKQRTSQAKAIIRTGECTPYANVILQAGVIF
ncbi:D-ribose pyranase [Brevibacillus sp. B_LB10_24]|uniref:D-ribose pyranase n=1 Tax=Brevibacillus sp. B_LB10_24 TaxID=3380645 RepID=UPI0038BBD330